MIDFAAVHQQASNYQTFLEQYGTPEQKRRWQAVYDANILSASQKELISGFIRKMNVLVMAGTWCGDCVEQCPLLQRIAEANAGIDLRFVDRDADPAIAEELQTCGAARVPIAVFLSEDGAFCGRFGDRTLSKYRRMAAELGGAACPTGLARDNTLSQQVLVEWLAEFERIQLMLRTSGRLRKLHGD